VTNLPWFALYVKPRHEKNVSTMLQGKGYEVFLPTYTHRVKYNKSFDLPLFPSYVFCRMEADNRLPVLSTPSVFSIIGNGQAAHPIPDEEIEAVRATLQSGETPIPWPYVRAGQQVRIESGAFKGVRALVVDGTDGRWLVVSVNLLQRSVAVRLQRECLSIKLHVTGTAGNKKLVGHRKGMR
jgi:transcription antitermination factor NusG